MYKDENECWEGFWKNIVSKEDGTVDLAQLKCELFAVIKGKNEAGKWEPLPDSGIKSF